MPWSMPPPSVHIAASYTELSGPLNSSETKQVFPQMALIDEGLCHHQFSSVCLVDS